MQCLTSLILNWQNSPTLTKERAATFISTEMFLLLKVENIFKIFYVNSLRACLDYFGNNQRVLKNVYNTFGIPTDGPDGKFPQIGPD